MGIRNKEMCIEAAEALEVLFRLYESADEKRRATYLIAINELLDHKTDTGHHAVLLGAILTQNIQLIEKLKKFGVKFDVENETEEINSLISTTPNTTINSSRQTKGRILQKPPLKSLSKDIRKPTPVAAIESVMYFENDSVRINFSKSVKLQSFYESPTLQPLMEILAFAALGKHEENKKFKAIIANEESMNKIYFSLEIGSIGFYRKKIVFSLAAKIYHL